MAKGFSRAFARHHDKLERVIRPAMDGPDRRQVRPRLQNRRLGVQCLDSATTMPSDRQIRPIGICDFLLPFCSQSDTAGRGGQAVKTQRKYRALILLEIAWRHSPTLDELRTAVPTSIRARSLAEMP